jgi:hypothetical protein
LIHDARNDKHKIYSFIIFFQPSVTFSSLGLKYPEHPVLKHPQFIC